jgi:hypothetical protein
MIYMWALPKASPAFAGVTFQGKVVYKTGYSVIMPDEVDAVSVKRLVALMKEVCGEAEPHRARASRSATTVPSPPRASRTGLGRWRSTRVRQTSFDPNERNGARG